MRYGIFSDIHGNLQAFTAVMAQLGQENIDAFLCVGDVVGYGANPQECIELLLSLKAPGVAGNHDWGVVGKTDIAYFNPAAQKAVHWTREHILIQGADYLKELKLIYQNDDLELVHGLLPHPELFGYLTKIDQAIEMFPFLENTICFVGHTHVPKIFVQQGDKVYESASLEIDIENVHKYIINVGSAGQPRDGNPLAAYCVYDTERKTVSIKRVPYNIKEAQKRILAAGLPVFLANRLAWGQ